MSDDFLLPILFHRPSFFGRSPFPAPSRSSPPSSNKILVAPYCFDLAFHDFISAVVTSLRGHEEQSFTQFWAMRSAQTPDGPASLTESKSLMKRRQKTLCYRSSLAQKSLEEQARKKCVLPSTKKKSKNILKSCRTWICLGTLGKNQK